MISKFEKEYSAFYKDDDPITFGAGTTYVCIVPTDCDVSFS